MALKSNPKEISNFEILTLTPANITEYGVCGYKDMKKHIELERKVEWFSKYYPKGLRIIRIISKTGGYQGMLEYIPGRYAHRPVNVEGYMFIHCIWVGFKNEFKGRGYASSLPYGNSIIKRTDHATDSRQVGADHTHVHWRTLQNKKGLFLLQNNPSMMII